jgi:hypothetical protein
VENRDSDDVVPRKVAGKSLKMAALPESNKERATIANEMFG